MATSKTVSIAVNKLAPAPGYLLVEPASAEKQTSSGIYLPDTHEEKPQYGKVLAVGAETMEDGQKLAAPAKKGDLVIYKKWGGNEFQIGQTEYQFLQFKDILAIVK